MHLFQTSPSFFHPAQLLSPSFAFMLANPEEQTKCTAKRQCDAKAQCSKPKLAENSASNTYIQVVEEANRFLLYTDLPGVKLEDLKVERNDQGILQIHGERKMGEETIKFKRQFMVDDQLIDLSQITASLMDGTLEIAAPKREPPSPRRVAVVAGPLNQDSEDMSPLTFQVDIPGVNVDSLQVEVHDDGKLTIVGERRRGGQTGTPTTIRRAFSLNRRTVNTHKVEAFLEDGVLTIRAPKQESLVAHVIPVSSSRDVGETKRSVDATSANDVHDEVFHDIANDKDASTNVLTDVMKDAEKSSASALEMEFEVVPETVAKEDE